MTTMNTRTHFNTGRLYSAHGQRITATLFDDRTVTFFDHDRMIDGEFIFHGDILRFEGTVLDAYDRGAYISTQRSWKDGMVKNGANADYAGISFKK